MLWNNKLLLFSFFLLTSCAFTYDEIRQTEDNFDFVTIKQDNNSYEFEIYDEEINHNFRFENKWYYWFDGHEVIKTEGGFDGTLLHGDFSSFHQNHQLQSKGKFRKGLKRGKWRYWDDSGKLTHIESWYNGNKVNTRLLLEEDKASFVKEKEKEKKRLEKKQKKMEQEKMKALKKDSLELINKKEEPIILNPR